jgi:hypothetical protein
MAIDPTPDEQWQSLVTELQGYRDDQRREWGDLDELLIARYLAGECDEQERRTVEEASNASPRVRECLELAREALSDVAADEPPLPAPPSPLRRPVRRFFSLTALASCAAAACLLIAAWLGYHSVTSKLVAMNEQIDNLKQERVATLKRQVDRLEETNNGLDVALKQQVAKLEQANKVLDAVLAQQVAKLEQANKEPDAALKKEVARLEQANQVLSAALAQQVAKLEQANKVIAKMPAWLRGQDSDSKIERAGGGNPPPGPPPR